MGTKVYGKPKKEVKAGITEAEVDALLSAAIDEVAEEPEPEVVQEIVAPTAALTPVVTDVTHTAYNTYFNSVAKKFMLVTIEYNPETKACRFLEEIENGDNLAVAMHKLTNIMALKLVRGEEIK